MLTGFAKFEKKSVLVIGQEKGDNLESRIDRNFGMMRPEGYRKTIRLMELADRFKIPIILFIDTPLIKSFNRSGRYINGCLSVDIFTKSRNSSLFIFSSIDSVASPKASSNLLNLASSSLIITRTSLLPELG